MTWSNTLVYSCECVGFVLLSYPLNVFFYVPCVVWCLWTCFIFRCNWCRDWISGMSIYVCNERATSSVVMYTPQAILY